MQIQIQGHDQLIACSHRKHNIFGKYMEFKKENWLLISVCLSTLQKCTHKIYTQINSSSAQTKPCDLISTCTQTHTKPALFGYLKASVIIIEQNTNLLLHMVMKQDIVKCPPPQNHTPHPHPTQSHPTFLPLHKKKQTENKSQGKSKIN